MRLCPATYRINIQQSRNINVCYAYQDERWHFADGDTPWTLLQIAYGAHRIVPRTRRRHIANIRGQQSSQGPFAVLRIIRDRLTWINDMSSPNEKIARQSRGFAAEGKKLAQEPVHSAVSVRYRDRLTNLGCRVGIGVGLSRLVVDPGEYECD